MHRSGWFMITLAFVALPLGCEPKGGSPKDTGETDADSDADADTDTDADADADSDADVDSIDLTFVIEGTWSGTALNVTPYAEENEITWWDPVGVTEVSSATQPLQVPAVLGREALVEIDPVEFPDFYGAFLMGSLHVDDDGDLAHDIGETVVGISSSTIIFFEDPIPAVLASWGFTPGWNAFHMVGETLVLDSIDAIPMGAGFWPEDAQNEVTIGGTWGAAPDPSLGVAVASYLYLSGQPTDHIYDAINGFAKDGSWSTPIDGPPPGDHLFRVPEMGMDVAFEFPVAYQHGNWNGQLDYEDTIVGFACHEGLYTGLLYIPEITSLDLALYAGIFGLQPGWLVTAGFGEGEPVFLDADQAANLVISPDCVLPP